MACNCGKKRKYVVTKKDGTEETVESLSQAMTLVRKHGGHYRLVKV